MKLFSVLLVLSLFTTGLSAQTPRFEMPEGHDDLRLFEFEFGAGINKTGSWDGIKAKTSTNFILEWRLNRPRPYDFGLQLQMNNFVHRIPDVVKVNSVCIRPLLYFDYNLRRDRYTSFFAGIGVGESFVQNQVVTGSLSQGGFYFNANDDAFTVAPRIGMVCMGGLRLTAQYIFAGRDYSCFALNVGAVLGGSYKKPFSPGRNRRKITL